MVRHGDGAIELAASGYLPDQERTGALRGNVPALTSLPVANVPGPCNVRVVFETKIRHPVCA